MTAYKSEGARRFDEARARLGETLAKTAEKLGTDSATVLKWLRGDVLPSLPFAAKIEREYGVYMGFWVQ